MSLDDAFGFDLDQLGLVMLLDIFEETAIYKKLIQSKLIIYPNEKKLYLLQI